MMYDAIIVGGGFYGTAIALYFSRCRPEFRHIAIIERSHGLLTRASYNNQARIHNGYHYPRSFTTGYRSRINLPRFIRDYPGAIDRSFEKIYAIARVGSKVTPRQFLRFCRQIGAVLRPVSAEIRKLFDPKRIEAAYSVDEWAFDARCLAASAREDIAQAGIEVIYDTQVTQIASVSRTQLDVCTRNASYDETSRRARFVFNCTYSGLNQISGILPSNKRLLKHEVAELALVRMPPVLRSLGITVVDGPFFSAMPFPARALHSVSHVRYTPHFSWDDVRGVCPYDKLQKYGKQTRVDRMLRDVARYLPVIEDARYCDSMIEIKTVLRKNEKNDARPILFERHRDLPGLYSILGGKIDNIYDVLIKLEQESFV